MRRACLAVLLISPILLVLLYAFLQTGWFAYQLSRVSAESLGRPVAIGHIGIIMDPLPTLKIHGVTLGAIHAQGSILQMGSVKYYPGFLPGWSGWRDSRFVIDEVRLDKAMIPELVDLFGGGSSGSGGIPLPIDSVSMPDIKIRSKGGHTEIPYRLDLSIPDGDPGRVSFSLIRQDGRMKFSYHVGGDGHGRLSLIAHHWVSPFGPALLYDKVQISGRMTESGVDLRKVSIAAYNGHASGRVNVDWGPTWRLSAQLKGEGIRMAPIIEYYGGSGFDGRFSGELGVHAKAASARGLIDTFVVAGPYRIHDAWIDTPQGPDRRMHLDRIKGEGRVNAQQFYSRDTLIEGYGGTLAGEAMTTWVAGAAVQGRAEVRHLDLSPFLATIMKKKAISGALNGHARFSLKAPRFSGIFHRPDLSGVLSVDKGVYYESDLENLKAGQTPFSRFRTDIRMLRGFTLLRKMRVASERLNAEGWVKIDDRDRLDGKLAISLKNTVSLASIHVGIDGLMGDPQFLPAASSVLGGVIGTGLLGPGWGTALGAKLGQLFESTDGADMNLEEEIGLQKNDQLLQ